MLKKKAKRILEYAAMYAARYRRYRLNKPELLVLGYHRIMPEEHPEFNQMQPGMRVRPETFRMHIQTLKKHFDIVDLNDWINRNNANQKLPNKAVAITFDDGWVDNYEFAFPILKSENIPATIFLVSSMIGSKRRFWPERVCSIIEIFKNSNIFDVLPEHIRWFKEYGLDLEELKNLDEDKRDKLIAKLKQFSDEKICESLKVFSELETVSQQDVSSQMLNVQQLKEMASSSLISFGAHTCNHYRLDKIKSPSVLKNEVFNCKQDVEAALGVAVTGFCYPNGDFNDKAVEFVKRTYEYACTTHKGMHTQTSDPHLMNRILVHDDVSCDHISFEARISGLL